MSELIIALLGLGGTIGGTLLGRYLGEKSERQNQQREMIFELYRPLIEDLRASIEQVDFEFYSGSGNIDQPFQVLVQYFNDSSVKAIEGYYPELYQDLKKIYDEILPLLDEAHTYRNETFELIEKKWIKILGETDTDANIENLANTLRHSLLWHIFRGDIRFVKRMYDQILSSQKKQVVTLKIPPEDTFDKILDSANEELEKVKQKFTEFQNILHKISNKAISKMDESIKTQFNK